MGYGYLVIAFNMYIQWVCATLLFNYYCICLEVQLWYKEASESRYLLMSCKPRLGKLWALLTYAPATCPLSLAVSPGHVLMVISSHGGLLCLLFFPSLLRPPHSNLKSRLSPPTAQSPALAFINQLTLNWEARFTEHPLGRICLWGLGVAGSQLLGASV